MNDVLEVISEKKILCSVGSKIISYKAGNLYYQDGLKGESCKLVDLPIKKWKWALSKFRPFERFLRLEPRLAIAINDSEFILSYQGIIYRINVITKKFEIDHKYRNGMNNTLGFCTANKRILYGEYWGNRNREEVAIYERLQTGNWKKIYAFPPKTVMHIHNITYDEYRQCYWILTGDLDNESALWLANDDFTEVMPIFKGKQKYRSCLLIPVKNGVLYNTDTPLEDNGLYFVEYVDKVWKEPKLVYNIPGPCIYGRKLNDEYYVFATSVEPDASLPTWEYRISSKLGNGVKDYFTHVYSYNTRSGELVEVAKLKKDFWKMWLFQFGNAMFPVFDIEDGVVFTGQSVDSYDGKSVLLKF